MPSLRLSRPKWSILVGRLRHRNEDPLADLIEKEVTLSSETKPKVAMGESSAQMLSKVMKAVNNRLDNAKEFYEKNEHKLLEPSDPIGRESNGRKR